MQTEVEMITDDEALREAGMTTGPARKGKFTLRPMTALSLSWMQRNKMFDDDSGDMMQKTAAFAYLHSEPKEEIRAVVNDRNAFLDAVDEWMDKHIRHHVELEPLSIEMDAAMQQYMAATSQSANPSEPQRPTIKN